MNKKLGEVLVFSSTIIIIGLFLKFGGLAFTGNIALDVNSNQLDLANFPTAFTEAGVLSGYVVHRGNNDVVQKVFNVLGVKASTCNNKEGKKFEDVVVANSFADEFGTEINDNDLSGMFDSVIDIDIDGVDNDYDAHDEIRIENDGDFAVHTGLSYNQDEDWEDKLFIPMERGFLSYYFEFDQQLVNGNFITDAAATDPITLQFLGKEMDIQAATANSITINVGQMFYLAAGDCVTVEGSEVCLIQTSPGQVTVTVGGVYGVIVEDDDERINGLEIFVEDVSAEDGIEYDAARLTMGGDARDTYNDGEAFTGEDEDDPRWVWDLEDLDTNSPTIGITWDRSADDDGDEDVIYEGDSLCLPYDFACLEFEGVKADDYRDYILEESTEDLYLNEGNATPENSSKRVLRFESKSGDGFIANGDRTDAITIFSTGAGLRIYSDISNDAVFFSTEGNDVFTIDYKDTTMSVDVNWNAGTDTGSIVINAPTGDDLTIYIEAEDDEFNFLGHSQGDEDTEDDILYGTLDLSSFDENIMTPYCVVILDPEGNDASDQVEMSICEDANDFRADVGFAKKASGSCFGVVSLVDTVHFVEGNMIIIGDFGKPFLTDSMLETYEDSKGIIGYVQKGNMKAVLVMAHEHEDLLLLVDRLDEPFEEELYVLE